MPRSDDAQLSILEAIEASLNTGKGKQLDDRGRELLDPRPVAPPVGYKKQPSMVEHIRNMVRSEMLAQAATTHDMETFEESDDFDVGDDYDPQSPYEAVFDPPPPTPSDDGPKAPGTRPEGGETAPTEPGTMRESGSRALPASEPPKAAPAAPQPVHST